MWKSIKNPPIIGQYVIVEYKGEIVDVDIMSTSDLEFVEQNFNYWMEIPRLNTTIIAIIESDKD